MLRGGRVRGDGRRRLRILAFRGFAWREKGRGHYDGGRKTNGLVSGGEPVTRLVPPVCIFAIQRRLLGRCSRPIIMVVPEPHSGV
jgi:hypothetical protein